HRRLAAILLLGDAHDIGPQLGRQGHRHLLEIVRHAILRSLADHRVLPWKIHNAPDILPDAPSPSVRGSDAFPSVETTRVHHATRRRGGMAAGGAGAATRGDN